MPTLTWIDRTYDINAIQEVQKYGGVSGTSIGPLEPVNYAEAFGAEGFMVRSPYRIACALKKIFDTPGPVVVGARVDYRDDQQLFGQVIEGRIH